MSPDEMPIVEAQSGVRFRNRKKLIAHAVKHVILDRDERWQAVIDEPLMIEARAEHRQGRTGPKVKALAKRYEEVVAALLQQICSQHRAHQHSCRFQWNLTTRTAEALGQTIDAWPDEERMVIAAEAPVKADGFGGYHLLTAFRPWPGISREGHKRKARERQRNMQSLYPRRVLEVHDD